VTSESLAHLSNNLLYSAMAVYTGAMYCYAAELAFAPRVRAGRVLATVGATASPSVDPAVSGDAPPTPADAESREQARLERSNRLGRIAVALTGLAFLLHFGAVVARGVSAGRPPWGNMFEFSTTGALAVTGAFLVLLARRDNRMPVRYLGLFVIGPVLLTLGLAVSVLYVNSGPLHTVLHEKADGLREADGQDPGGGPAFMSHFPSADAIDRAAYRMHAFAFPIWTFAVIAGAIWAENAWGRYWGWDPKETWAFITWLVYACYLHARATAGWRGRKAAYLALLGYSTFLFNYLVVNIFLVGLHSYAGVG